MYRYVGILNASVSFVEPYIHRFLRPSPTRHGSVPSKLNRNFDKEKYFEIGIEEVRELEYNVKSISFKVHI